MGTGTRLVERTQIVMTRDKALDVNNRRAFVYFPVGGSVTRTLFIEEEELANMGDPEEVTVTIQPGNQLNEFVGGHGSE